jgi:hypothetical protein
MGYFIPFFHPITFALFVISHSIVEFYSTPLHFLSILAQIDFMYFLIN